MGAGRPQLIEEALRSRLAARAPGRTICPSEVAREVGGAEWRDWMEPVREVAWRLAEQGELEVTQQGHRVDRRSVRGPIRLGHPSGG